MQRVIDATPFAAALRAVAAPLEFAAANDFARAERVRDLETSVASAAGRAAALAIPPEARRLLEGVRARFDPPLTNEDAGRAAIADSLRDLAPLRDAGYADRALARAVATLPGVGPKRAQQLAQRGLRTVSDLLFHLPTRYDDRRERKTIGALPVGSRGTFVGEVVLADFVPIRGRARIFQAVVGDGTGTVNLKWFRGGEAVASSLKKGVRLRVTGEIKRYRFDKEIIHAEIDVLGEGDEGAGDALVPEYTTPEGIPARTFRRLVASAVADYADLAPSVFPEPLATKRALPPTPDALRAIHAPGPDADPERLRARATAAHERLVLEELYLLEVGQALRHAERAQRAGIAIAGGGARSRAALAALPFTLTNAQQRAWGEIARDLALPHPMSRLLQGDVGSGKTVVAALGAVAVAEAGAQSALMAPTEILAEQHAATLRALVPDLRMALLTASVPRAEASAIRARLAAGELDLVVGTHALVQGDVRFTRLALAVIDEQHRFGVMQRAALAARAPAGFEPHVLVMTATPIPRSLALTLFGDLDVSVIDELPPGRMPTRTELLRAGEGRRVMEAVRATLARGEQAYVVYPLVEESEKVDLRAATESADAIRRALPQHRVDLVHGRQSAAERAAAMDSFKRGRTHILVSTTVIEVGVDVANATLMVVEHAERFGLAQLHQLRGRVGRASKPGVCLLVARGSSEQGEARLRAMLETSDGFVIADHDLRIRGPGDFLGTRQHGLPELHFADLVRDARLVALAREAARETVRQDPRLRRAPDLARAVEMRWGERLALVGVG
jgi:ATP-dependent DNA helicase RecG